MKPSEVRAPVRFDHLHKDERGYPVIATVGRAYEGPDFGGISEIRKIALATFEWCAVCGLPFGAEPRYLPIAVPDTAYAVSGEAPVHEICAMYSAQVCPHLSSSTSRLGDELRRGERREQIFTFTGFDSITDVQAPPSPVQPGIRTLVFIGGAEVRSFSYASPTDLRDRYYQLLAEERQVTLSDIERKLDGM